MGLRGAKCEYDRAIADFTELIRLDRKLAYAYQARGNSYDGGGEYGKAIADFTGSHSS